ncbi:MAG: Uma2 family endonuclease [Chloroflexi bacterium]|nr:Uma2 family endonuclease [Chloroflexota bacterium]
MSVLTLQEYAEQWAREPFEYLDGERLEHAALPLGLEHLNKKLFVLLANHIKLRALGEIWMHKPFVLTDASEQIVSARLPHLLFVRTGRARLHESGLLLAAPDLVLEIIAQTSDIPVMYKKVNWYLKQGVQRVWLLDPNMQTLSIYRSDSKEITALGTRHSFSDAAFLPGFQFAMTEVFG